MGKDSFILYTSYYRTLAALTDEQFGGLMRAIFRFVIDGEEPADLDPVQAMAFGFMRESLVREQKKYDAICERNKKNGSKGGRPKKPVGNTKTQDNSNNPLGYNNEENTENQEVIALKTNQQEKPKKPSGLFGNPNDNDNDNDNEPTKVGKNISSSFHSEDNGALQAPLVSDDTEEKVSIKNFIEFFNREMEANNALIPQIKNIENNRLTLFKARIRQHGKRAMFEMVRKAARSDYLNGKLDYGNVRPIDWLLRPNNFTKVLDGNYDNDKLRNHGQVTTLDSQGRASGGRGAFNPADRKAEANRAAMRTAELEIAKRLGGVDEA